MNLGSNRWLPLSATLILALALGCSRAPEDPWSRPINADSAEAWQEWSDLYADDLGPIGERDLKQALHQLTLQLQIEQSGLSSDALKKRLRERIHGRSSRQVITEALLIERARMLRDREVDVALVEKNRQIAAFPGAGEDVVTAMNNKIADIRHRQEARETRLKEVEPRLLEINPGRTLDELEAERTAPAGAKASAAR